MAIIYGNLYNLLHNNGMLSHINEAILISTFNIQFHDEIRNFP